MRPILFLTFIVFVSISLYDSFAQNIKVKLNTEYHNFFEVDDNPETIDTIKLIPRDEFMFTSVAQEFAILIKNAEAFIEGWEGDAPLRINSWGMPEIYRVKEDIPDELEIEWRIYCITNNSWVDAPPRIIVRH